MATLEAFAQAGIDEAFLDEREVGILYGNDSSAEPVITARRHHPRQAQHGTGRVGLHLPVNELNGDDEPLGHL